MKFIQWLVRGIVVLGGLSVAPGAWACSCHQLEPDEFVGAMAILFEGSLLSARPLPPTEGDSKLFETVEGVFKVHRVYKGELGTQVRILYWRGGGGNCGISFKPYETVIVAAHGEPESGYATNMCLGVDYEPFRTQVLEAARRYRERLNTGDQPQ